mgnify:CR=1 FL=1
MSYNSLEYAKTLDIESKDKFFKRTAVFLFICLSIILSYIDNSIGTNII